jgi:hypothetical protein
MCKLRFLALSRLVLPSLATFFNALLGAMKSLIGDAKGVNIKAEGIVWPRRETQTQFASTIIE